MTDFIIDFSKKHFPSADEWMWDYCTFLGQFTDSSGDNYDLGIVLGSSDRIIIGEFSLAVVYGNDPGNYISGGNFKSTDHREFVIETLKRARKLNLIN